MNIADLAKQQAELNIRKHRGDFTNYFETIYIAIREGNHVVCSKHPIVLENAKNCILVHKRSCSICDYGVWVGWYDYYDVEYISETGDPLEECIDKYYRLFVRQNKYNEERKLVLKSSDGFVYECSPSWNNMASIQDCFQSVWNLYNELKKVETAKERATIVELYKKDETILNQKKEIANFSYANALLEKERDMYKGLLDDIKQLIVSK